MHDSPINSGIPIRSISSTPSRRRPSDPSSATKPPPQRSPPLPPSFARARKSLRLPASSKLSPTGINPAFEEDHQLNRQDTVRRRSPSRELPTSPSPSHLPRSPNRIEDLSENLKSSSISGASASSTLSSPSVSRASHSSNETDSSTSTSTDPESSPTSRKYKEGWLLKLIRKVIEQKNTLQEWKTPSPLLPTLPSTLETIATSWKKYYVVLKADKLLYYTDRDQGGDPVDYDSGLSKMTLIVVPDDKYKPNCMEFTSPGMRYPLVLMASSPKEREEWDFAFNQQLADCNQKLGTSYFCQNPSPAKLDFLFAYINGKERKYWNEEIENQLIFPWKNNGENMAQCFLASSDWQLIVLKLFRDAPITQAPEYETKLFANTMLLFVLVHHFHFKNNLSGSVAPIDGLSISQPSPQESKARKRSVLKHIPYGSSMEMSVHELFTYSLDFIKSFAGWEQDSVMLGRSFLYTMLNKIQSDSGFKHDPLAPEWQNLFQLVTVVEQFVFYRPDQSSSVELHEAKGGRIGLHMDSDGICLDIPLVSKILQLLNDTLRVSHVVPHPDPKVAKDQKKWQALGIDTTLFFTDIQKLLTNAEKGLECGQIIEDLATAAAKRKGHVGKKKLQTSLTASLELVHQRRKASAIALAGMIAKKMYLHQSDEDRKASLRIETEATLEAIKQEFEAYKQEMSLREQSHLLEIKQLLAERESYKTDLNLKIKQTLALQFLYEDLKSEKEMRDQRAATTTPQLQEEKSMMISLVEHEKAVEDLRASKELQDQQLQNEQKLAALLRETLVKVNQSGQKLRERVALLEEELAPYRGAAPRSRGSVSGGYLGSSPSPVQVPLSSSFGQPFQDSRGRAGTTVDTRNRTGTAVGPHSYNHTGADFAPDPSFSETYLP